MTCETCEHECTNSCECSGTIDILDKVIFKMLTGNIPLTNKNILNMFLIEIGTDGSNAQIDKVNILLHVDWVLENTYIGP